MTFPTELLDRLRPVLTEAEKGKILSMLHPILRESLREHSDYMGPVRVSDAEKAQDVVRLALQP